MRNVIMKRALGKIYKFSYSLPKLNIYVTHCTPAIWQEYTYIYISYTFQRSKLCPMTVEYETCQENISLVLSHNMFTYK